MVIVLIGQFIKNIGGLPCAYVFMALFADNLDHLEWKTGFRSDGTAMSIYNVIAVAAAGQGSFSGICQYHRVAAKQGKEIIMRSAKEVARLMLNGGGCHETQIKEIGGDLTDN